MSNQTSFSRCQVCDITIPDTVMLLHLKEVHKAKIKLILPDGREIEGYIQS